MTKNERVGAVLVIGGGPAGMQAALDLADSGFKVYLLETTPSIGGTMSQLDKTFPTNDCSMCILSPKLVATGRHENVTMLTYSVLKKVEGQAGNFKVTLAKYSRYIVEEKCTGCGVCAEHCPIEWSSAFDRELAPAKAIYVPFPQAVPLIYTIDRGLCIGCGICEKFCEAEAIKYDMDPDIEETIDVGAIILAPGYDVYNSSKKVMYGHGTFPNVLSNIEFERMLSASGPTEGHVIRPSDGDVPKNIAFIQCVGSRDAQTPNTYCSSYCCMAALKQAVIAQEHVPGLKTTIFFMDTRAFGKEFEEYLHRAEDEYGVRMFRNNRIAKVQENPGTSDLVLGFIDGADIEDETFDMVVLASGATPPESSKALAKSLGMNMNKFGFCETDELAPVDTSVPGIYVCGAFSGPKDIPDSVAQASGAAGKAAALLSDERGKLVTKKEYPEEKDVTDKEPRIGVFVCHCGINIGSVVDVPGVMEYASKLPGVVYAEENLYTCSQDTQKKIKEMIDEHDLNRVVVASCTPRTHEPLFQNTVREAGLNKYLFEMANIRDQCSWVHRLEPEAATEKSKDLVRMAVAKASMLEPLPQPKIPVTPAALVIGGGLSGMTAALEIAKAGYEVHIVEKEKELGGHMRRIHHTLAGVNPQETLANLKKDLQDNTNVTIHLGETVEEVKGYIGNFETTLKGGEEIKHGAVVVASGAVEYEPTEYLCGQHPKVIKQTDLGDMLAKGELDAKAVAIIQCVGSRNEEHPNCSRICCSTAMANALKIREEHPETSVYILFRDIRTFGFAEENYNEAARQGVRFLRYDPESPPKVRADGDGIIVEIDEKFIEETITIRPDYVVLNAAVHPNPDNKDIAQKLKVPQNEEGFFLEAHMKLRPVDFATDGIFLCGLAHSPRLIDESISQALAAAARVNTVLSKPFIEGEGVVSVVDEEKCIGCGRCVDLCEYGAPRLEEVSPGVFKSKVNEALCKGCGSCVVECCSRAIRSKHFRSDQIITMIEAALADDDEEREAKA
ncbi:MAG: CoB--CoM heterodisulfide reductase iron-sulfur subunit A family protein [Candidatus Thermoplasmatota archaeon]|nr:CoB--CoM heterodisulfide reductase iron-sulfur subunit A family protein [Candidatus Thermoplasmatota archaeon]